MLDHAMARGLVVGVTGFALASIAGAQAYVNNLADIPGGSPANNSSSENVDFGDIDLDGDFDALFADGGDSSNDQNRLWLNQGFAQAGTLGVFVDATVTRLPAVGDQSRDVEFVDFDADGDLDVYVSNTSAIINQTNRWWTNQGGLQAASVGFYVDETAARWLNLGGLQSSIAGGQVLGPGGFIDFSCDCDFADLDNDGDLDLVHSSYGGIFGGNVPTRLFLNDGLGFFSEFNPGGAQLVGQVIPDGFSGLWCEGTHEDNTTNATGLECDIAATPLDIDVGDLDSDNDIDILHGARDENTRIFRNNLEENGGTLTLFRDVSFAVFPAGWSPGGGHYEQEIGDSDNDGDLDIYGLNWASLSDFTLENDGAGNFGTLTTLSGSGADDNEGDFVDYDNDGDMDIWVASFFSSNRLYRNNNNGGGSGFSYTEVSSELSPQNIAVGLDADGCDVDGDGDTDVLISHDNGSANSLYENTLNIADTHAPLLFHLEQAPNRLPGPDPTVIRVQVYDNSPYYITWFNNTRLSVTVNGGSATEIPMVTSGGQVFRGEIPGGLTGNICYEVLSTDQDGNTGSSGQLCFTAGSGSFCDASDGALASCPCGNAGDPTSGCDIQQGTGGVQLDVQAQFTTPANRATLTATGFPASSNPTAIVIRGTGLEAAPVVFGDGLRCVTAPVVRLSAQFAIGGSTAHAFGHGTGAGPGTFFYQVWFRNSPAMFCTPSAFNLSNGRVLNW